MTRPIRPGNGPLDGMGDEKPLWQWGEWLAGHGDSRCGQRAAAWEADDGASARREARDEGRGFLESERRRGAPSFGPSTQSDKATSWPNAPAKAKTSTKWRALPPLGSENRRSTRANHGADVET
jgi:hypothetical protein